MLKTFDNTQFKEGEIEMRNKFRMFLLSQVLSIMMFMPVVIAWSQDILSSVLSAPVNLTSENEALQVKKQEIARQIKTIQIPFIANNGQVDKQVKFYASTFGGTVFVTKEGEIVYALPAGSGELNTKVKG